MKSAMKTTAGGLAGATLVGYALICAFMYSAQTELIFHPTSGASEMKALCEGPGEAFDVNNAGVELHGALILSDTEGPSPVLMYFGGNAESVSGRAEDYAWMREAGVHLLLLPYRGYDGCGGSPSADGIRADALAAYDHLTEHPRVDPEKIYALGYSLGSGVADYVSTERKLAGLMLVSPYRRLGEIAEREYPWLPVSSLIEHDFENLAYASDNETPLIVAHGDQDTLIPIEHGRDIVEAWKGPARLVTLDGHAHNGSSTHPKAQAALREMLGLSSAYPNPSADPR
jgi:dipeptidyl aminopeptidase/acylaminoacyl peptidase